ncbi:MAG: CvpA family protein [Candidatus Cloacimonadales bacterium]|nr:CvpA family protein [Candidatus Cloacimonadales bacterium]
MQIIDIILGVFLLLFLLNGLRKGLIASVLGVFGLIVIIVLIANFSKPLQNMLIIELGLQEIFAIIISYVLIILVISLTIRLISYLLKKIMSILNLGCADRILGMVFGLLNGALIIAIILVALDLSPWRKHLPEYTNKSVVIKYIRYGTNLIEGNLPELDSIKKPIEDKIQEVDEKINKAL